MRDIGVITPYVAQVRVLRKLWAERCRMGGGGGSRSGGRAGKEGGKKRGRGGAEEGGGRGAGGVGWWEEARDLEIASVDNFQGREKELILFSAVRCNRHGQVRCL